MDIKTNLTEEYYREHDLTVPYSLSTSSSEITTVGQLLSLETDAAEKFEAFSLSYPKSTQGDPELRKEIAKLSVKLNKEHILVTSGATEGIFLAMTSLLEAGDHIIVQFPLYQLLYETAKAKGCSVSTWDADFGDRWELSVETLKSLLRPNTKMIVTNFPHNPTGYTPTRSQFIEFVQVAKDADCYFFSDEAYRFLVHKQEDLLPSAVDLYEKAIAVGSLSKNFGLPGLRIGWIALEDQELLRKFGRLKDYTTLCTATPSDFLATLALRNKQKLLKNILGTIKNNLQLLRQFFEEYSDLFDWIPPKAGTTCFPKMRFNAPAFCREVSEEAGILLNPGSLYEYSDKYFRVGFGKKDMPEVLGKFKEYLNKNREKF